ncbi:hypothetical protein BDV12DRAFT_96971 [Aspergillus spectabilis]
MPLCLHFVSFMSSLEQIYPFLVTSSMSGSMSTFSNTLFLFGRCRKLMCPLCFFISVYMESVSSWAQSVQKASTSIQNQ